MQTKPALKSDLDCLLDLNRDYLRSVQNSDVSRFQEILAEDFLCSLPNGSLQDREGFLKHTAVAAKIWNLEAHDVKVRLLGNVAIIHARTTYTTPDGRSARAATPTSGHVATANGSPFLLTSRAVKESSSGRMGGRPERGLRRQEKERMTRGGVVFVFLAGCGLVALSSLSAQQKNASRAGWISDESCAAQHTKPGRADCVQKCWRGGLPWGTRNGM